jgi:two-component system, response regulator PdtaR
MQNLRKRRILVVEDKVLLALLAEEELTAAGYDVVGPVATQKQAVQEAVGERPDLVLTDIGLKEGSGIAAATEILNRTRIRCIFVTAEADMGQAAAAHPLAWVNKPYIPSELLAAISDALASFEGLPSVG